MNANAANKEVVFKELSYKICGVCFDVHNNLGRYRNEKQYADALEAVFKENNLSYLREFALPISFDGEKSRRNIVDFLIDDKIILDLKAKTVITKEDYFQMKRYLNSANKKLGIIVNFRQKALVPQRVLNKNIESY